ncbi:MAG: hypothetical protein KC900_08945 [Candidatus Omnitrophica bacterium]|nr:hypothetical protein [Candidatus Omnitrophota bacterium]
MQTIPYIRSGALLLALISFCAWIIPLGAFIRADQEGKICNGRRLVCMCTHRHHQHGAKDGGLTFKRPGGRGEPGLDFPSFGGTMETVLVLTATPALKTGRFIAPAPTFYPDPQQELPEPVPKPV